MRPSIGSRAFALASSNMSAAAASSSPATAAAMAPQLATFLIDGSLTRPEYLKLIAPRGAAESLVKRILENLRVEKDGSNKGKQQQVSGTPGPGPGKGKAAAKVGAGTTMRPLLIATIVTACPDAVAASSSFASSSTKTAAAVIASDLTASATEGTAAGESSRNAEASSSSALDQVGSTSSLVNALFSSLGPLTPPILFHHTFQPYDAFLASLPQLANYFPPARGAAQQAQESGSGASSLSFSSTAEHWLPFGAGLGARLSRFLVNEQERNQAGQQRQQGNGEASSAPVAAAASATDEGLFDGFLAASEMVEEHVLARRRRSRIVLARRPKEGKGEDEVEPYLVVMSGRDPRVFDGGGDAVAPAGSSSRIVMTTTRLLSPSLSPEDSRAKTERPAGGDQTPSSLAVPLAPTDLTAEFSPASAADGFEQQQQRQHRSRCSRSCWNRSQKRDDWRWVDVAQELESQRARLAVVIATRGDTPKEAGPTDGGSSVLSNLVDRLKAVHGTNENAWWVNASNGFKSDILGFTKSEPIAPAEPSSATPLTDKNINGKRPIDAANSPLEQDLAMEAKRFKADAEAARAQKLAAAAQFATKGAIVASAGNLTPHQLSLMQQARAIQAQAQLANGTDPAAAAAAVMIANAQQAGANQQQTPAMQAEIARRAAVDAAAGASQPTSAPPQQPNRPSVSVWRGKLASRPTGRNEQGQIIFDPGEWRCDGSKLHSLQTADLLVWQSHHPSKRSLCRLLTSTAFTSTAGQQDVSPRPNIGRIRC